MKRLKIGVLQQHNTADNTDNKTRLVASIKALAEKGAQLIVLQELHNTLYFCHSDIHYSYP
jgi:N-carbamoylputrescine amidase